MPVCACGSERLPLCADGQAAIPRQTLRTVAGPGGPARRDAHGAGGRLRRRGRRVDVRRPGSRGSRAIRRRRAVAPTWNPHQCRSQRCAAAAQVSTRSGGDAAAADRPRSWRAQHPRRRPHVAGRVDAGRSRRADLPRGRAGRHGAEFPPGWRCAMTDIVMRAVAYLSRVVEPPCPQLAALVACVGPVEAAERVKRRALDDQLLPLTEARHEIDCAAQDLAVLARLGGRLVTAADDEWPLLAFTAFAGVDTIQRPEAHPPLALWVTGPARLDEVADRAAAIVGTRAATAYGEHVAAELAAGLAERDAAVVSGGAYGIDGAAHQAALAADGFTVAILAGGIDVSYPAGHSALFHRIGEQGLLVTEYPPGLRPQRHRFLTRSRLVATVSGATVVVEAGAG